LRHDTVGKGGSAVCNLLEDGALTDEPDVLHVGDAQTGDISYVLPVDTLRRAKRWFSKHANVK
jgi:hypothetical protein